MSGKEDPANEVRITLHALHLICKHCIDLIHWHELGKTPAGVLYITGKWITTGKWINIAIYIGE